MIRRHFILSLFVFFGFSDLALSSREDSIVVVVDKAKYELHVARNAETLEILKTYPTTLGKNSGDKVLEGDLKTPEGIYLFTQKYVQPQIKKKFGAMAFYMDYPNLIDKREKKTGFDIMLHSTDDPARLERPQDSDGCIVLNDERISEVDAFITPGQTMIMVYENLLPEYKNGQAKSRLKAAFEKWIQAWSAKDFETYIGMYSDKFSDGRMNKNQYREYKSFLNKKYDSISVQVSDVHFYPHPKYSLVTFYQHYVSKYKNGREAFNVKSRKRAYFVEEAGEFRLVFEGN